MEYTVVAYSSTYPAGTSRDIWLLRSALEQSHADDRIAAQQHAYKYRRGGLVASYDASRSVGAVGAYTGFVSSATAYPSAPVCRIPVSSALATPDDYDANAQWQVVVRFSVSGTGDGYVKVVYGAAAAAQEWQETSAFAMQWSQKTLDVAKLTANNEISVYLKVSVGTAVVTFAALYAYVAPQGTIGV